MTKKEFSTFCMALKTFFPRDNILPNEYAMELWFRELQDLDFSVAEAALREYVHTNKFAPTIAEIRAAAATVKHGQLPDWGDGWEQVLKAIRNYGSYRVKDAMNSFDPVTRQTVERLDFMELCKSTNIAVDRANFRQIYQTLAARKQTEQQIAVPLQTIIAKLQEGGHEDEFQRISAANQET